MRGSRTHLGEGHTRTLELDIFDLGVSRQVLDEQHKASSDPHYIQHYLRFNEKGGGRGEGETYQLDHHRESACGSSWSQIGILHGLIGRSSLGCPSVSRNPFRQPPSKASRRYRLTSLPRSRNQGPGLLVLVSAASVRKRKRRKKKRES